MTEVNFLPPEVTFLSNFCLDVHDVRPAEVNFFPPAGAAPAGRRERLVTEVNVMQLFGNLCKNIEKYFFTFFPKSRTSSMTFARTR